MKLYYKIKWTIIQAYWGLRKCYLRFKQGYAWSDVWDMDQWFIDIAKPMLTHLKTNGISYPTEFKDRDEWCAVLDEMITCLELMEEDKVYEFIGFGKYEDYWRMTTEDRKKAYEIRESNKNRFFELFSKHFYDLWD